MVRYMVLQYRDELLALLQGEITQPPRDSHPHPTRRYSFNRRPERSGLAFSEEEKDRVMTDLLVILQKIPIQVIGELFPPLPCLAYLGVIAVNSLPLVYKVRFVASTLLDALATPLASATASPGPAKSFQSKSLQKTQRAQSYLCANTCGLYSWV
jgi:hypothetical protein